MQIRRSSEYESKARAINERMFLRKIKQIKLHSQPEWQHTSLYYHNILLRDKDRSQQWEWVCYGGYVCLPYTYNIWNAGENEAIERSIDEVDGAGEDRPHRRPADRQILIRSSLSGLSLSQLLLAHLGRIDPR